MSYGVFAEFSDGLTRNVDYNEKADHILKIMELYSHKPGVTLDLACGTGSLSVELKKRGIDVFGADMSEEMLTRAQMKAQENGLDENGEELHYVEQLEGTLIEALNDSAGDKWQPILILQSNTQPFEESEHTHIVAHFNEAEGIIPKEWIE